ncbi:unnamed protein product, partial [Didymodactylos carnosus]
LVLELLVSLTFFSCFKARTLACSKQVYTQNFTQGLVPVQQCSTWKAFGAVLNCPNYTLLRLSGSMDKVGVTVVDPIVVNNIASALKHLKSYGPVSSNGRSWVVGICDSGYELSANGRVCYCIEGYTLRPCVASAAWRWNWGGIHGSTCSPPSQTITVTFE